MEALKTPVIFIIFKRKIVTERVFEEIRKQRPEKLYISADGPRPEVHDDVVGCTEARKVVENIDWPCEVIRDYSEENLGCEKKISTAITKAFELYEEAIILEDDCLPNEQFFDFCEEMLKKYRDDDRVMHISGHHWPDYKYNGDEAYVFSSFARVWGWATWRNAWKQYNKMEQPQEAFFERGCKVLSVDDNPGLYYCKKAYNEFVQGKALMWDFRWVFSILHEGGVCVTPTGNFITNIGDYDGAHVVSSDDSLHAPLISVQWPLVCPSEILVNEDVDAYAMNEIFIPPAKIGFWKKLTRSCKKRSLSVRNLLCG